MGQPRCYIALDPDATHAPVLLLLIDYRLILLISETLEDIFTGSARPFQMTMGVKEGFPLSSVALGLYFNRVSQVAQAITPSQKSNALYIANFII